MNARDTSFVAEARHQLQRTQGSLTGDLPTIEQLTVQAEAEGLAKEAITNLYYASGSPWLIVLPLIPLGGLFRAVSVVLLLVRVRAVFL